MATKKYKRKFSVFGYAVGVKKEKKRKVSFMGLKVRKRKQAKTLSRTSRIIL